MGTPKDSEKTRAKIISCAGKLFSQNGYKGVTVRDIVEESQTNQGALNYHFKSKELLYREVILEACRKSSITPKEQEYLIKLSPDKALKLIISESLKHYSKSKDSIWQSTILTRECWDPSNFFLEAAEEYFKPETNFLASIIGRIVDKSPKSTQILFSVITLTVLIDMFSTYGIFINAVAPKLTQKLKKRGALATQLYDIVIDTAKADTLQ